MNEKTDICPRELSPEKLQQAFPDEHASASDWLVNSVLVERPVGAKHRGRRNGNRQ